MCVKHTPGSFCLGVQTLQSLLPEGLLVLCPCSRRRGGAESLINTAVTRVKPPEARRAFTVPPLQDR